MKKLEELTSKVILDAIKDKSNLSVHYYVTLGNCMSVELNGEEYVESKQKCSIENFFKKVENTFMGIESKLNRENIYIVKEIVDYQVSLWVSSKVTKIKRLARIGATKEFGELQKFLTKKANFNLSVTDLYWCNLCKKRDSVSTSNYEYIASSKKIGDLYDEIKSFYKSGYKVTCKFGEEDYYESGGDYEYENYGTRVRYVEIVITTPKGNKSKVFNSRRY